MGAAALLAMVVGVPAGAAIWAKVEDDDAPTDRQRAMMREVAQIVIPKTGTLGAGEVGAGDFVILALAHGLDGTRDPGAAAAIPAGMTVPRRPDGSLRHLDWLEAELDRRAKGNWAGKDGAAKTAAVAALDAEAYGGDGRAPHPWKAIKGLILTGYYTSEVGGSQELRYEPVPGRFDPALPMSPGTRAISNDWTAVDFG
ncbi:twin-arginine translocation pathway signal protein [Sphingomonas spermidinifaciens]|uniref:Twin-arginine translocation pathway signal protein n=2 Tax=Sphingomonas spermidinifaciens TaxID=1141889 RepID=A0A2A4AYC2_9SPHN|nr:twin-arginine translocation pathway signal protein [Sphingomonas spermidinifaciens]